MNLDTYADLYDDDLEAVADVSDESARVVGAMWAEPRTADLGRQVKPSLTW